MRRGALRTVLLAAALAPVALALPVGAQAFPTTLLPGVAPGETWVVCQGYNGVPSHSGPRRYALDLTAHLPGVGPTGCWGGEHVTAGRKVTAPGDGRIAWNDGSGFCVNFDAGDSMKLYHVTGPGARTRVKAGQVVGKVHQAGKGGSGPYAHLHIAAYKGGGCAKGKETPFAGSARLACGAPNMTASGRRNQWSGTKLSLCALGADPRGKLDSASSPAAGKVRVRGWSFDPDSPKAANRVHVYVGGKNHKTLTAKAKRDDVAKAHKAAGANHGFDVTVPTELIGKQKVCAYGINLAGTRGGNAQLGCKTVTIKAPPKPPPAAGPRPVSAPAPPKGNLDTASSPAPSTIRVRGWTFDPNDPAKALDVHVYVGGSNHRIAKADLARNDVAEAFENAENPGPNHGFDVTFTTAKTGTQQVCVYAINLGSGSNPKIGCKNVTIVPGSPPLQPPQPAGA